MNKGLLAVLGAALLVLGAQTAKAEDTTFKVFWKDGIRGESGDGDFKFKLGGRVLFDAGFFGQDDDNKTSFGTIKDGTEFRRARLQLEGTIYQRYIFKAQYDFANGSSALKDAYLGITGIPYIGRVRIGQSIEPLSLDQITSSNYSEFMERGLTTVFAPDRNPGINLNNAFLNDRITYGFGVFRNGDDTTGNSGGDGTWGITGRVTGLPWYQQEDQLLHIGVAARYTNVSGTLNYSARPEAHLSKKVADTGAINAARAYTVGPELAFVYGPFSLQGEYMWNSLDASTSGDPTFGAYTVAVSYWLTGESRRFKTDLAEFDRVKPKRNLFQSGGLGAWELALRYSNLDLTDGSVHGGNVGDVTAGINWQWNPNMRMMFNYVHSNIDGDYKQGLSSVIDLGQVRWQVDF